MIIKKLTKPLTLLFSITLLLVLTACGEGDSTPTKSQLSAQKVTVTFALQGAPATVYSAQIDVRLPDGFVLEMDNTTNPPTPTASALTVLVNGDKGANYIPADGTTDGKILAAIAKIDGFAGDADLMQISCTYAAGATLPTAEDFTVTLAASDSSAGVEKDYPAQISIKTEAVPR